VEDRVEEAASAEWSAIISECIDSGALALWPPPEMPSKGVKVDSSCCCCFGLSFCFFSLSFNSAIAGPSRLPLAMRPCLSAPPLNPGR